MSLPIHITSFTTLEDQQDDTIRKHDTIIVLRNLSIVCVSE